jgi:hypothetical protein
MRTLSHCCRTSSRRPAEYVRAVTELLENGTFTTTGGDVIEAEQELRNEPVASAPVFPDIDEADWILAATMRDDSNIHFDIDGSATGWEAMSWWREMAAWTDQVLGLGWQWETCLNSGELDAIRHAQEAVAAGGIAFLLVDSDLIHDGEHEVEEKVWWRARELTAGNPVGPLGALTHCRDDNWPPDHWVVFLDLLKLDEENDEVQLLIWSWHREWIVSGSADSFSEYLYGVVTGLS